MGQDPVPYINSPFVGNSNVRFIHPPRLIGVAEMAPHSLAQDRGISENPARDCRVVHLHPRSAMSSSRSR